MSHPAYKASIVDLANLLYRESEEGYFEDISYYYKRHILHQMDEIKRKTPEVFRVLKQYGLRLNQKIIPFK